MSNTGKLMHYTTTYIGPLLIIIYCLYFIISERNFFAVAHIPLTSNTVHSYSMILFALSFMVFQITLKHIPIVARFIISFALISLHGYIYNFLWDINNIFFNSEGYLMSVIDICAMLWLSTILLTMRRHYPIFKPKLNKADISFLFTLFLFQIIGFYGLYITGFWIDMNLYNHVGGSDPNMNPFWVISKLSVFFLLYPLLVNNREDESNEIEPPRFLK